MTEEKYFFFVDFPLSSIKKIQQKKIKNIFPAKIIKFKHQNSRRKVLCTLLKPKRCTTTTTTTTTKYADKYSQTQEMNNYMQKQFKSNLIKTT